jgi:putative Holliday junction resolvase
LFTAWVPAVFWRLLVRALSYLAFQPARAGPGAVGRRPRPLRLAPPLAELGGPDVERGALELDGGDRGLVLGDAALRDRGQGRDGAGGARELPEIAGVEQDPEVPGPSAHVQGDELLLHVRQRVDAPQLELGQAVGRLLQEALGLAGRRLGRLELRDGQIAGDLAPAQVTDQRLGFPRQALGFALERRHALGDPAGGVAGVGPCLGRDRELRRPQESREQQARPEGGQDTGDAGCHSDGARIIQMGRIAGLDVGERRIGVAVSDATATLARPVGVVTTTGLDRDAVARVVAELARLSAEDDPVELLVVGLPRHLDGSPSPLAPRIEAFAARLGPRAALPIVFQDERLTSHEAEARLALRVRDWRVRKARLDAAAAAVILQEYLDAAAPPASPVEEEPVA